MQLHHLATMLTDAPDFKAPAAGGPRYRLSIYQVEQAARLAERLLPETLKRLAHEAHFEKNYRLVMESLPWLLQQMVLFTIRRANGHADPLKLFQSGSIRNAYEFFMARMVIGMALANKQYRPGTTFGLLSMTGKPLDHAEDAELRRYDNFMEVPDFSLSTLLSKAPDVIVIGSGPGGAMAAYQHLRHFPNDQLLALEGGPYFSARDIARMSPGEASEMLFKSAALMSAFNMRWKAGISGIPTLMGEAIGGTNVVYSASLDREPDDRYRHANWESLDEYYRYATQVDEMFDIRPIPENLMSPLARTLLYGAQQLRLEEPAWMLEADVRAIETAFVRQCQGWGRCNAGCPGDYKVTPSNTLWEWLLSEHPQNALLAANQRVLKLRGLKSGRITAVQVARVNPWTKQIQDVTEIPLSDRGRVYLAAGAWGSPNILYQSGLGGFTSYRNLHFHPITEVLYLADRQHVLRVMGDHPLAHKVWSTHGRPQASMVQVPLKHPKTGNTVYGRIESALTPWPVMAFASPGLVGEDILAMQNRYREIGLAGVLYTEDASSGTVLNSRLLPSFWYPQDKSDYAMMLTMLEYTMQLLAAAGVTDMRLNMIGPPIPGNSSQCGLHNFFSQRDIFRVMEALRSGRNEILQFGSHAGQTTTAMVGDFGTGQVRGVDNLFMMDYSSMQDVGTHPTRPILGKIWSRVDRIAQK